MQAIIDAFNWLIDTIGTLFDFVSDFIGNLFTFFEYLMLSVGGATQLVLTLPYWLQGFGSITITVIVIYMIVGRRAGGNGGKGG